MKHEMTCRYSDICLHLTFSKRKEGRNEGSNTKRWEGKEGEIISMIKGENYYRNINEYWKRRGIKGERTSQRL